MLDQPAPAEPAVPIIAQVPRNPVTGQPLHTMIPLGPLVSSKENPKWALLEVIIFKNPKQNFLISVNIDDTWLNVMNTAGEHALVTAQTHLIPHLYATRSKVHTHPDPLPIIPHTHTFGLNWDDDLAAHRRVQKPSFEAWKDLTATRTIRELWDKKLACAKMILTIVADPNPAGQSEAQSEVHQEKRSEMQRPGASAQPEAQQETHPGAQSGAKSPVQPETPKSGQDKVQPESKPQPVRKADVETTGKADKAPVQPQVPGLSARAQSQAPPQPQPETKFDVEMTDIVEKDPDEDPYDDDWDPYADD